MISFTFEFILYNLIKYAQDLHSPAQSCTVMLQTALFNTISCYNLKGYTPVGAFVKNCVIPQDLPFWPQVSFPEH